MDENDRVGKLNTIWPFRNTRSEDFLIGTVPMDLRVLLRMWQLTWLVYPMSFQVGWIMSTCGVPFLKWYPQNFPDIPLVGYEEGDSLTAARSSGWRPVGPLRVWIKSR